MHDHRKFYINGEWAVPAGPRKVIEVENPATTETVGRILQAEHEDIDRAVAAAKTAFESFSQTSREERLALLGRIIEIYKRRETEIADIMTAEMGAARGISHDYQAPAGLGHLQSAYNALREFEFDRPGTQGNHIFREPIGVCAFITPWNWPLNQIAAKVAPAIATGCTCVLKPSELAPLSAHVFAEIMEEAGTPAGVFNLVDGDGPGVGAYIAGHADVDMVSFTGSTRAGVEVSKLAAPTVKRVTLELGGKSANVILDDADFETAVTNGTLGCMANVGQSCDAPTRMLVERSRYEEAVATATEIAEKTARELEAYPEQDSSHFDELKAILDDEDPGYRD